MGATAAVQYGLHKAFGKNNPTDRVVGAINKYLTPPALPDVPAIPAPPSALDANIQAGKAMSDAVRRYRRQSGGGLSSTIKTGGAGDPSQAPTIKKTLLGV